MERVNSNLGVREGRKGITVTGSFGTESQCKLWLNHVYLGIEKTARASTLSPSLCLSRINKKAGRSKKRESAREVWWGEKLLLFVFITIIEEKDGRRKGFRVSLHTCS